MTGKGHLASGAACFVITDSLIAGISSLMSKTSFLHGKSMFSAYRDWIFRTWPFSFADKLHINEDTLAVTGGGSAVFVYVIWAVYLLLFLFGSLLPDIDSKNSMLGRYFHLPVKHHRLTHTLWFLLPFLVIGVWLPPFFWIGMGYMSHLFIDSLGRAGNCWLYPLTRYIEYDSGAFVKKGHKLKLYRTGSVSEGVVAAVFVAVAVACIVLRIYFWKRTVLPV